MATDPEMPEFSDGSDDELPSYSAGSESDSTVTSLSMSSEIEEEFRRDTNITYARCNNWHACESTMSICSYSVLGCTWGGPSNKLADHEKICKIQNMTGAQVNELLIKQKQPEAMQFFSNENFPSGESAFRRVLQIKLGRQGIKSDEYFLGGTFEANNYKWVVDLLWQKKNAAHKGQSTISCRLEMITHDLMECDECIRVQYFFVKEPYSDDNCITKIMCLQFNREQCISSDSVILIDSAKNCNRFIESKDTFLSLYFDGEHKYKY